MPMNTPYPVPITALSGESRHPRNRCENRALGHGEPPFADRRPPDAGVPPVLRRGRDRASRRGANADLVRLATGLRIASTAAQMSAAQTSATARALDGPLAAVVQAPPTNSGKRLGSPAIDAGAARVGTGDLRAQATWPTGYRCGTPGPAATSSVALAEAAVLPGRVRYRHAPPGREPQQRSRREPVDARRSPGQLGD